MRRGVRNVLGAGAAALCLGGLLSACGGDSGDGYVATGAAGASPERAPGKTVGPSGEVKMVPLDRDGDGAKDGKRGGDPGAPADGKPSPGTDHGNSGSGSGSDGDSEGKSPGSTGSSGSTATPGGGASSGGGADSGRTEGSSGSPSAPGTDKPGTSTPPSGPAELKVGAPEREAADKRWCEKVTVAFRNTGGSPVRSGTVTFGTHIIGALGVDWDTIESTVKLPVPIGPGQRKEKTWTVCVDAWRVPLGMHIETQDVEVSWK